MPETVGTPEGRDTAFGGDTCPGEDSHFFGAGERSGGGADLIVLGFHHATLYDGDRIRAREPVRSCRAFRDVP